MRLFLFFWIFFGLLIIITIPVRAEFQFDKITMKLDSTEGEEIEKDLYCYSDWKLKHFNLDLTNKFSWPENNENFSKFNVKAGFENYKQLKLNLDYQWNERYRILSPEINYYFELGRELTIGLEYETDTRNPVLDKDQELKYCQEIGTVIMELDKDKWSYDLKLTQAQKDYPDDELKNYIKNQLNHEFAWRIQPNLKLQFSFDEATGYYPYDIEINQDYWRSEAGIGGEYRFNNQWQIEGAFSAKEAEKGLAPYLAQQYLEVKLKNKPTKDVTINLRVSSTEFDYYSEIPYIDPDEITLEDEDQKSRDEYKVVLECQSQLKKFKLVFESGLFWVKKDYNSTLVEDFKREGFYASLRWNPGKIGLELEMAPDGNHWRTNGFYQLKVEYTF